jgi:hypothetical protein
MHPSAGRNGNIPKKGNKNENKQYLICYLRFSLVLPLPGAAPHVLAMLNAAKATKKNAHQILSLHNHHNPTRTTTTR